ncbi:biosynthetic peptidoglycan transglycosylase [Tissierella sp.]|uniref:biosynthetic peptidoglycan transglycosylase n=1 Tax=Tissierella sp. TaxID=41274 RepID=UPI0028A9C93C|nr:biosynthetic peptidoglycan transglycosylase [Tissierella sp.]
MKNFINNLFYIVIVYNLITVGGITGKEAFYSIGEDKKRLNKNNAIKTILAIFLSISILVMSMITPIVLNGYEMYKEAINKKSLDDTIEEIRGQSNFISLNNISDEFLNLVLKSEDHRFYKHSGFDFIAIARAMYNNIKAGKIVQGGSTITQQLAKNSYFSFDKKYERKVAEVFVAKDLERKLTKDEILELYCNVIYFGEGCYGIKDAAKYYYGIEADKLTLEQAKALVKTLKSPNNYNPKKMKLVQS